MMPEILTISSTSHDGVRKKIYMANIKSVFFAHGLFPGVSDDTLNTIVDEFGRAANEFPDEKTALMLAVNSHASLNQLRTSGQWTGAVQGVAFESAQRIKPLLQMAFPGRPIVLVEFNDVVPDPLYQHLKNNGGSVKVPYGFTVQGTKVVPL